MFLHSLIEELCTKDENDKTGCNFNFGHECINAYLLRWIQMEALELLKSHDSSVTGRLEGHK